MFAKTLSKILAGFFVCPMPELPEVETIRRDLEKRIVGKKIAHVEIRNTGTIHGDVTVFQKTLTKNSIEKCERIGKLLIFALHKKQYLLVHLKMTGKFIYREKGTAVAGGYTRIIFTFVDGSELFFQDVRKFGYMTIVSESELEHIKKKYGIEPLTKNFTLQNFEAAMSGRKTSLKVVLLNQARIAGIGNIYADEICFVTSILPSRSAQKLSSAEIQALHAACNAIIQKAIEHRGTTFNSYVDGHGKKGKFANFLQVYQRQGKSCFRCPGVIAKVRVAGRGTHFCPKCQK